MNATEIRKDLICAATAYDIKQSMGTRYNPYALAQYYKRIDDIMRDIEAGADPRAALCAAFTGTLLSAMLRALKLAPATRDELRGTGKGWTYHPVAR